jgi:hypothetical protein
MKNTILILVTALLVGCQQQDHRGRTIADGVKERVHEGHTLWVDSRYQQGGIMHAPTCECLKED